MNELANAFHLNNVPGVPQAPCRSCQGGIHSISRHRVIIKHFVLKKKTKRIFIPRSVAKPEVCPAPAERSGALQLTGESEDSLWRHKYLINEQAVANYAPPCWDAGHNQRRQHPTVTRTTRLCFKTVRRGQCDSITAPPQCCSTNSAHTAEAHFPFLQPSAVGSGRGVSVAPF